MKRLKAAFDGFMGTTFKRNWMKQENVKEKSKGPKRLRGCKVYREIGIKDGGLGFKTPILAMMKGFEVVSTNFVVEVHPDVRAKGGWGKGVKSEEPLEGSFPSIWGGASR